MHIMSKINFISFCTNQNQLPSLNIVHTLLSNIILICSLKCKILQVKQYFLTSILKITSVSGKCDWHSRLNTMMSPIYLNGIIPQAWPYHITQYHQFITQITMTILQYKVNSQCVGDQSKQFFK